MGKTTTTANLAASLARLNFPVVVLDADAGLRNLDLLLGLENCAHLTAADVLAGNCHLDQALIRHPSSCACLRPPWMDLRMLLLARRDLLQPATSLAATTSRIAHLAPPSCQDCRRGARPGHAGAPRAPTGGRRPTPAKGPFFLSCSAHELSHTYPENSPIFSHRPTPSPSASLAPHLSSRSFTAPPHLSSRSLTAPPRLSTRSPQLHCSTPSPSSFRAALRLPHRVVPPHPISMPLHPSLRRSASHRSWVLTHLDEHSHHTPPSPSTSFPLAPPHPVVSTSAARGDRAATMSATSLAISLSVVNSGESV
ncbi:hypothetical protein ACQ4PT_040916 [Festuca glaucescens]